MESFEIVIMIFFAVLTFLGIFWVAYRRHQSIVETSTNPIPTIVKEQSHQVKNEVTKVRAGLRRIANADDPLEALVSAIRSRNEGSP